jgi:hypothetical protein
MTVIGVVVGDEHRVQAMTVGGQQLLPEVWTAIDQQEFLCTLDQER